MALAPSFATSPRTPRATRMPTQGAVSYSEARLPGLSSQADRELYGWRGGEVERWRDGEVEGWRSGEVESWKDVRAPVRVMPAVALSDTSGSHLLLPTGLAAMPSVMSRLGPRQDMLLAQAQVRSILIISVHKKNN